MSDKLPTPNLSDRALGVVRAFGPLLISQSKKCSELLAEHQSRMNEVAVAKDIMFQEVKTYMELRDSVIRKHYEASPEQRIQTLRDLKEIEQQLNRLKIYSKAIGEL